MTEKQRQKALDGLDERVSSLLLKYRKQNFKNYHPTLMDKAEVGL